MSAETQPEDAGRRRRRGAERAAASPSPPPAQPLAPFAPLDLVSKDELESIHRVALRALEEIGIDFLHDGARAMLKDAGAEVEPGSQRVRFDAGLVEVEDRARAEGIHPARAQPGARSADRRAPHRLRIGGERAQFLRSRRRSKAGRASRLPELPASWADLRIRSISGAAIRSSRSTFMPRSATSTRSSTC